MSLTNLVEHRPDDPPPPVDAAGVAAYHRPRLSIFHLPSSLHERMA